MWGSFVSIFSKDHSPYQVLEHGEPDQVTNFVYRDSLNVKNKLKLSSNYIPKKSLENSKQVLSAGEKYDKKLETPGRGYHSSVEEKGVIRVKVTMTKQEAARLLSKCKEGGVLGFKDVANELVHIPVNRVNVESTTCPSTPRVTRILESIPE